MKRFAIYLDQPFWHDGQTLTTDAIFVRFLLAVGSFFDEIHLFVHLNRDPDVRGRLALDLEPGKVCVHALPFVRRAAHLYQKPIAAWQTVRTFQQKADRWDLACIVLPHWTSAAFHRVAVKNEKKAFLYLRSNFGFESVLTRGGGWRGPARILAWLLERSTRSMVRQDLTLVVGDELYELYQPVALQTHRIYPTVLSRSDLDCMAKGPVHKKAGAPFRLLSVGRLTPEKGLGVLVEAVSKVVFEHGKKVVCDLIGSGKGRKSLQEAVRKAGLQDRVVFRGFVDFGPELFRHYQTADCYLLPSLTEGIPKTIVEALAFGTPIIASDVGGIRGVIEHEKTGLLVRPGDAEDLSNAILRLMSDEELRCRLAQSERDLNQFTIEVQSRHVYNILAHHFHL